MKREHVPDWQASPGAAAEAPQAQVNNGSKQIVTIRLDVDMLEWFKSAGPGYQTRVNQVLRDYMDAQREKAE
ncbi:MAG TPA: BrnA antitoxin family protein [Telluria sp.]|nr:BrnA antitoxin family protein [Telluria sp.]